LADEFSGNGIAVLCIHAAIAMAMLSGSWRRARNRKAAITAMPRLFLASVIPIRTAQDKAAMRSFQTILNRKDEVSYMGEILDLKEVAALITKLEAFASWAEKTSADLQQRAPSA